MHAIAFSQEGILYIKQPICVIDKAAMQPSFTHIKKHHGGRLHSGKRWHWPPTSAIRRSLVVDLCQGSSITNSVFFVNVILP